MNTTMGGVTNTTDSTDSDSFSFIGTGDSSPFTGTGDSSPSTHIDSAPSTPVTTDGIMSTRDFSSIGVIIGGAIGGVVVMLLVGMAIVALCVMVIKFRQKYGIEENDGIGFGNTIYQGSS